MEINNDIKIIKLLENYNLTDNSRFKILRESTDNIVYSVGTKEKKILRLGKHLPIQEVEFEIEIMQRLRQGGIPVPEPVRNIHGDLFTITSDNKVVVMFDFIEGYHAISSEKNVPNINQTHTAGVMLGKISKTGVNFKPHPKRQRTIFSELERALRTSDIFRKEFDGGEEFIKEVESMLNFGKNNFTNIGIVHNDYRPGNVIFKSDLEIVGVIDFDWCCIGAQMKDLGLSVVEWSLPDGQDAPNEDSFRSFLDGYYEGLETKGLIHKDLVNSWIRFACLSDACTYFCDRFKLASLKKSIRHSYMYNKYLIFSRH